MTDEFDVLFVGAGPRAISALERLLALYEALEERPPLKVALVDPFEAARGRTWRSDQDRLLLNNSSAADTTMFTDTTVPVIAPVRPGPALDEWARTVVDETWPADDHAEAKNLQPWMQPSRVLQGAYYRWVLDTLDRPSGFTVTEIRASVSKIDQNTVLLDDGRAVGANVVVLSQGFVIEEPDAETRALTQAAAEHGLTYVPPAMASETDWSQVPEGQDVLVRGLAATFFDVVGVLFEGRGGRFVEESGGLRYLPSGQEPRLLAGSRTGLPKRTQHAGRVPQHRVSHLGAELVEKRDLDWATEVWPLVRAEVADAFERVAGPGTFDWAALTAPTAGREFNDWPAFVTSYLDRESSNPNPWQAARAAVLAVRPIVERLELAGCFNTESGSGIKAFQAAAGQVTSGPPAVRFAQFAALCRQGHIVLTGPGMRVDTVGGRFRATSDQVPGTTYTANTLIEAFFPFGNLNRVGDPLVHHLISTGQARLHARPTSYDIDPETYALREASGAVNPARIVLGMTGSAHQRGVGRSGIPCTGDRFFVESDRAAVSVFEALGLPVNP